MTGSASARAVGTGERAQRSNGRATKARILEAAADLMFRHGVAGTSIPDIQAAAEVSASQIYHHFQDKAGLVRAVIVFQTDAALARQQPLLGQLDSIEALEAWRDAVIDAQRVRGGIGGCELGSLANELANASEVLRAEVAAGFARWEQAIRDGLRAMHARGELRPEADPDQLALALVCGAEGGMLMNKTRHEVEPLAAVLNTIIARIADLATSPQA